MAYALLRDSWPVAKKQHRCIWCGEGVLAGEKYYREQSIYEGQMQNHAWHEECIEDARETLHNGDDEFLPYSNERPERTKP